MLFLRTFSLLNFDTDTSWLILKDHAERKLQENAHPSFWVALGQLIRRVMTAEPSIPDVPDPREANSSEDEMLVDEKQDDEMESSENRDLQKRQVHALSFVQVNVLAYCRIELTEIVGFFGCVDRNAIVLFGNRNAAFESGVCIVSYNMQNRWN